MIGNKKIVALCTGKISDHSSHSFVEELAACLWEFDCKLFVYSACSDMYYGKDSESGEEAVFSLIDYDVVDALVLLDDKIKRPDVKNRILDNARKHNVPIVTAMALYDDTYNVIYDGYAGFLQMVRHVLEVHKPDSVHFIAGFKNDMESQIRLECFQKVMEEQGRSVTEDMISYGDFWSLPTEKAVIRLIETDKVPDAIICANDVMAIATCETLRTHGFKIPEDVIVTGYDGLEDIYYSVPQITSCACDYPDVAREVAKLLSEIFQGTTGVCTKKMLPREVLSQSCGCGEGVIHNLAMYQDKIRNAIHHLEEREQRLSEASAGILMLDDLKEASELLYRGGLQDMCCILTEDCLDEKMNPFQLIENGLQRDKMVLFYDADEEADYLPRVIERKQIVPELDQKMDDRNPIYFFSLYFQKSALGYVSFFFRYDDANNYTRISQTINFLNNTINSFRSVRYQKYLMRRIESLYRTDGLTNLLNRNAFYKEYTALMSDMRENETITVLLADLNGLKRINDIYGHNEGDNAIRVVADAISEVSPKGSLLCRYGGDELLMVTRTATDVVSLKEACKHYISRYNETTDKPYVVAASIGICQAAKSEIVDFEQLFIEADRAMYREKEDSRR